jgi:hypothetical protein
MRQKRLAYALLAALALSVHAARADQPVAAGIEIEICRLPGSPSEYSDQEIDIPAGTVFAAADIAVGDATAPDSAAASSVGVITAAPVAIAAAAFCARAPIRLADPAEEGEVHARIGSMLLPLGSGGIRAAPAARALDAVYGLLRNAGE